MNENPGLMKAVTCFAKDGGWYLLDIGSFVQVRIKRLSSPGYRVLVAFRGIISFYNNSLLRCFQGAGSR
jgi:hypothetical protein